MTILIRSANGRNLGGIDSHVTRPIMTAFLASAGIPFGTCIVTCLKKAISFGRRHGKLLLTPMPSSSVAATMRAKFFFMSKEKDRGHQRHSLSPPLVMQCFLLTTHRHILSSIIQNPCYIKCPSFTPYLDGYAWHATVNLLWMIKVTHRACRTIVLHCCTKEDRLNNDHLIHKGPWDLNNPCPPLHHHYRLWEN